MQMEERGLWKCGGGGNGGGNVGGKNRGGNRI